MKKVWLVCLLFNALMWAGQHEVNRDEKESLERKRKETIELVEKAKKFVEKNTLEKSFQAFSRSREFIQGEIYIFVFDMEGYCYAHGQNRNLVWSNMWDAQDEFGSYYIRDLAKKAQEGGGWVSYEWLGASKVSYVKPVKKGDLNFFIGAGYYPHSKADAVVNLVKGAVNAFNRVVELGQPLDRAWGQMTYPGGQFVRGDLYLYAVRFDGMLVAQGERPIFIGTNVLDRADQQGKMINRVIIDKLRETPKKGVWVDYISTNAPKRAYAERVVDDKDNEYFIACGYYPTADRGRAVDLVRAGYKFLKTSGLSLAVDEFADSKNQAYMYGDLYLTVWDMKGTIKIHGRYPELNGRSEWDRKDQDGNYFVREIIDKAREGGGWVSYKLRNAFQSTYCEEVQLGVGKYVIGCGVFPVSKEETTVLMARSAAGYLRDNPIPQALEQFSSRTGQFLSGEIGVFVCDTNGIFLCDRTRDEAIWKNLINAKDDNGKPYVRMFINSSKDGPAKVTFTLYGSERVAFVEQITKGTRTFVVGSAYYV